MYAYGIDRTKYNFEKYDIITTIDVMTHVNTACRKRRILC